LLRRFHLGLLYRCCQETRVIACILVEQSTVAPLPRALMRRSANNNFDPSFDRWSMELISSEYGRI
jgi:hypothetical protein